MRVSVGSVLHWLIVFGVIRRPPILDDCIHAALSHDNKQASGRYEIETPTPLSLSLDEDHAERVRRGQVVALVGRNWRPPGLGPGCE